MIRLRQLHGAHTGREVEFDDVVVRIGRLPGSDLPFDPHADRDASGLHAELHRTATGYRVVDQDSRNGTWVNGTRVTQHELVIGDEIEFGYGGPRLRVEELAAPTIPGTVPGRGPTHDQVVAANPPQAPSTRSGRGLLVGGVLLVLVALAVTIYAVVSS